MDDFKRACPKNGPGGWNCPYGCCGPQNTKQKDRRRARRKLRRELRSEDEEAEDEQETE